MYNTEDFNKTGLNQTQLIVAMQQTNIQSAPAQAHSEKFYVAPLLIAIRDNDMSKTKTLKSIVYKIVKYDLNTLDKKPSPSEKQPRWKRRISSIVSHKVLDAMGLATTPQKKNKNQIVVASPALLKMSDSDIYDAVNSRYTSTGGKTRAFNGQVKNARAKAKAKAKKPAGTCTPEIKSVTAPTPVRDCEVRGIVLERANGRCDCCGNPVIQVNTTNLGNGDVCKLIVHHLYPLRGGDEKYGWDTPSNAVAVCGNCHDAAHLADGCNITREESEKNFREKIYMKSRLNVWETDYELNEQAFYNA